MLTTLGERVRAGEATDLAAPLPMEVDRFLETAESDQRFGYDEFVDRVAERTGTDRSEAAYHARLVVDLLGDVVPGGELDEVRAQPPDEYDPPFEPVD